MECAPAEYVMIGLGSFQTRMVGLVDQVDAIDLRRLELAGAEGLWGELCPQTLSVLKASEVLLGQLMQACEADSVVEIQEAEPSGDIGAWDSLSESAFLLPFEHALDAAVKHGRGSTKVVDEIAFFAKMELRQRIDRVTRAADAKDPQHLLVECDGALRRIRKSLSAVDATIAKAEAVPRKLVFETELDTAVWVRQAYGEFRHAVFGGGTPAPEELYKRFRRIGTHIPMLTGKRRYHVIRVQDRLLFRALHARILGWLREHGIAGDPVSGTRLWQDICGFAEMLKLVNRRQELVAHDRELIEAVLDAMDEGDNAPAAQGIRLLLEPLAGYNDDIDAFLREQEGATLKHCRHYLVEALHSLKGSAFA